MRKLLYFILIFILLGCAKSSESMPTKVEAIVKEDVPLPAPPGKRIMKILTPINEEKIINSISKGDINYMVQDTMIVNKISEVNMTISQGVNKERIISEVNTFNKNNLHTDSIRISPVMRARLVDPSDGVNFRIVSKTNDEQFLEDGDYTRWTWDVTPLIKGNSSLSIVVDVIFNDKSKSIQVYDGVIYVYSDKTFFQKLSNFFIENWQYIFSSLLIPILIFLYKNNKVQTYLKSFSIKKPKS